ncbi:MAG TPA: hypothetical protein VGN97_23215 [Mesorhizobium sp.]|jgi:hypothetical protein|nr:hypothetical protein [Mesorhizobium sp.]
MPNSRGRRRGLCLAAVFFAWASSCAPATWAADAEGGAWAARVQTLYNLETRTVERRLLKVWDFSPERNLDFSWEPEAGAQDLPPDGVIEGKGKLVWLVRGAASYDKTAVFSSFEGEMKDGRPHGKGRLEIRSGETFEGSFRDGLLEGRGVHVSSRGDRYEGEFRQGRPEGRGRLALATGEIYEGLFRDGLRHGAGETRLAGGTRYTSRWTFGVEEKGARPSGVADALLGGFLRVQDGGEGAAARAEIAVSVDPRMTQQSDMRYVHLVDDQGIAIYPEDPAVNDVWNGADVIDIGDWVFTGIDWESAPAFVEVELSTTDGKRVKLDDLELRVDTSEAYRKPMLSLSEHVGCVGFRPSFSLLNHGWGKPENARLTLQFAGAEPDTEDARSRSFTVDVGAFDDGMDVMLDGVLREAGVNTDALAQGGFTCPSMDNMNVCRASVFNTVGFGDIADFVWGEDKLFTTAVGQLDYDWRDDHGNVYHATEPLKATVALATIEVPTPLAECGDGFGGSPEALRYQDVRLPINKQNYAVPLQVRGNRNVSRLKSHLKMSAEMSSYHVFRVAAGFADGTERLSPPVSLYYYKPKPSGFVTGTTPAQCTLPEEYGAC